jgi:hypothetical protein
MTSSINEADLFKVCRIRLGMSIPDLQVVLCLPDDRPVRRIEYGDLPVLGATWVALMYMLDEDSHDDLAAQIEELLEARRDQIEAKLSDKWQRWQVEKRRRHAALLSVA